MCMRVPTSNVRFLLIINVSDEYTSATNCAETIPSKELLRRQVNLLSFSGQIICWNTCSSSVLIHFCSPVKIKASDPINQLSLEDSVRGNLQTCAALHGDSFNAAISSMHPAAFAQLKQALKMP